MKVCLFSVFWFQFPCCTNLQAVSILNVARHVCIDRALDDACALLAPSGGVVAERVLLAHRARGVIGASHVRGTNAVALERKKEKKNHRAPVSRQGVKIVNSSSSSSLLTCFFVTPGRGRTPTLLAVGEPEESWLAAGTLSPDHIGLAVALPAHLRAAVALGTLSVAVAWESAAIEGRTDRNYEVAAHTWKEDRSGLKHWELKKFYWSNLTHIINMFVVKTNLSGRNRNFRMGKLIFLRWPLVILHILSSDL